MATRSSYSEFDKEKAVAAWVTLGTVEKAAAMLGYPANTIYTWKNKQATWWNDLAGKIRTELEEEHRAGYRKIMLQATQVVIDRLELGDIKVDAKTKEEYRQGISGRDAATILGIATDKLNLSLGKPTSISGNTAQSSVQDKLSQLRKAAVESGVVTPISKNKVA